MKIEKILTGFAVALMMLTACSNEEAISVPTGPASLSFSLSMGETKADQQTVLATRDELYVSRFYVGIYDGDTKVEEFRCEDASGDSGAGWTVTNRDNNKNLYTITNLVAPVNKDLNILVIANYPDDIDLSKGYSDLKKSVTTDATLATTTFAPKTLIKVGKLEGHKFTESNTTARVNLKQLAAKVHVKLTMGESDSSDPVYDIHTSTGEDVVGVINRVATSSGHQVIKAEDFKGSSLEGKIGICSGNAHGGDLQFPEGFDKSILNINHSGKWLVVLCDSVMTRTVSTWTLIPSTFQVNNVAIASFISSPATGSETTDKITYPNKEDVINDNIIELTFYTYPKRQNSDLTLSLGGKLQKISKVSESKKAGGVIHGQWCDENGTEASGWGNGSMIKAPGDQQYFPSDWSEWVSVGNTPLNEYIDPVSYEIPVNKTTALESGVYYDVTGTLKQSILELNVNALKWVPQEVEVSYGK
ncbi:hypothetical protein [uncultured Parabacteroides sp.]|uniref:hypothetical protein n=1 Tax=uncultured Parabacteroides sp. TaxID=512312 RepID=UPI0025D3FAB3|nr:hypothetical protein [uncultured Parabacteroides sp.]